MRLRVTLITLLLLGSLLAAGSASAGLGKAVVDRGIVQSVTSGQVVLKALDGSTITITIGPHTKVFLNDAAAPLGAIQPGYVATALHEGGKPAVYLRAVGRAAQLVVDKGVILSVSSSSVVLRTSGGVVTIAVGPTTSVQLNGRSAGLGDLKSGFAAEIAHRGTDPAVQIKATRTGRR